jgi:MftR C-terminal domain
VQASFAQVLTDFVRKRYSDTPNIDLVSEVAGATLAAALVVAVEDWGRHGCTGDLGQIVADSVNLVRTGFASLT